MSARSRCQKNLTQNPRFCFAKKCHGEFLRRFAPPLPPPIGRPVSEFLKTSSNVRRIKGGPIATVVCERVGITTGIWPAIIRFVARVGAIIPFAALCTERGENPNQRESRPCQFYSCSTRRPNCFGIRMINNVRRHTPIIRIKKQIARACLHRNSIITRQKTYGMHRSSAAASA
jgi:hypothetical protein